LQRSESRLSFAKKELAHQFGIIEGRLGPLPRFQASKQSGTVVQGALITTGIAWYGTHAGALALNLPLEAAKPRATIRACNYLWLPRPRQGHNATAKGCLALRGPLMAHYP